MISLYISNLKKYTEGNLIGEWIQLPFTREQLEKLLKNIGINKADCEEYIIMDFQTDIPDLKINEYDSIEKLNILVKKINRLTKHEKLKFSAILEMEAIENYENVFHKLDDYILIEEIKNKVDLGYYYAEISGFYGIEENNPLFNYINFEDYGQDIYFSGNGVFTSYGWLEYI